MGDRPVGHDRHVVEEGVVAVEVLVGVEFNPEGRSDAADTEPLTGLADAGADGLQTEDDAIGPGPVEAAEAHFHDQVEALAQVDLVGIPDTPHGEGV